jgi:hypothetical protein
MSLTLDIRKKIVEVIESGTFYKVVYNREKSNMPILGDKVTDKPIVYVNETQATVKDEAKNSSMGKEFNLGPWNFEAKVAFPVEVDISEFVTKEMSGMKIISEGFLVIIKTGGYNVEHPVSGGPHTGTKVLFNLIANTRR